MNIKLHHLCKRYGEKTAIHIDELQFSEHGIMGFVGNNGAGKTTLFKLLLRLTLPCEGTIEMEREGNLLDLENDAAWKRFVSAYLDETFLIEFLTSHEFFDFLKKVYGLSAEDFEKQMNRLEKLIDQKLINEKTLIRDLSAGNKQKVGIAAALLGFPEVVILDEPFNFLDPSGQNALKEVLTDFQRENQALVIVSSHNIRQTADICDRIILLENGLIVKDIDNKDKNAGQVLDDYFTAH